MEQLLGNELRTKSGEVIATSEALQQKKIIGLYFSAAYCPPCRAFTPVLSEMYEDIQEYHDDFEVVFVSSDKEVESFDKYYGGMPWLALPWQRRDLKADLCAKFGVEKIPSLVFVNAQGDVIEREGRSLVEKSIPDTLLAALRKLL